MWWPGSRGRREGPDCCQGFRVLLTPFTYMAQASLSTGSPSHLLPVGEQILFLAFLFSLVFFLVLAFALLLFVFLVFLAFFVFTGGLVLFSGFLLFG